MKNKFKYLCAAFVCAAMLLVTSWAMGAQYSQQVPADNTKTNQRDRDKSSPTADKQKRNPADRELTRKIRFALHKDNTLSTYGHNIKIISQDGKVTLKGPVRSEEEKANIAAKAMEIAGADNVDNQLDVVPPKQ